MKARVNLKYFVNDVATTTALTAAALTTPEFNKL